MNDNELTTNTNEHTVEINGSEAIDQTYPSKPKVSSGKNQFSTSIISAVIYLASAHFILNWDLGFILKVTGVLVLHELGHFMTMKLYKYKNLKMLFLPMLGAAVIGDKDKITQKENAIVALAGPLPGIILGVFLYAFGLINNNKEFISLANIAIIINAFNLLPFMPLDGGRIFNSLFFNKSKMLEAVFIIISILCLTSVAVYIENYILLIIPLFLVLRLVNSYKLKKVHSKLDQDRVSYNKSFDELNDEEYWKIRKELAAHFPNIAKLVGDNKLAEAKQEEKIIMHVKNALERKYVKDLNLLGKIGFVVLWLTAFALPLLGIGLAHLYLN
ncbi:site-2 protease family protein [Aureibacter tunicatorum]|uniref:Zn-dependent protease n=1 Tax=Aureibacter tunicatorum TaxID=866807 RepID=A0AAE3XN24_9BACT|nr:site-2 protease family protein [Aureibacter tunicatorum]MDR6238904.1 Zn-dependent protease [Aureibacter tunicatorum]BDD05169.1 hypothetical protein AUTU_26520 [Aureibacter tunicatorum]